MRLEQQLSINRSGVRAERLRPYITVLQIKLGDWYDKEGSDRKVATQYHEVMGGHTYKWLGVFPRIVIIIALGGDALAQIIASSNFHTMIPSVNKRYGHLQLAQYEVESSLFSVICWRSLLRDHV